jgi:hypothetical protein
VAIKPLVALWPPLAVWPPLALWPPLATIWPAAPAFPPLLEDVPPPPLQPKVATRNQATAVSAAAPKRLFARKDCLSNCPPTLQRRSSIEVPTRTLTTRGACACPPYDIQPCLQSRAHFATGSVTSGKRSP